MASTVELPHIGQKIGHVCQLPTWMHNELPIFLQGRNPCSPFIIHLNFLYRHFIATQFFSWLLES